MREGQRSLTAEATAAMRAAHQVLDAPPLVLRDDVAARLLLPAGWQALARGPRFLRRRRALHGLLGAWLPPRASLASRRLRAQIVVRSRYAEDCLGAAIECGVSQYVVLAAGLDTFALRQKESALRIFEVDEPATQADKRRRIEESGLRLADNVEFVGIDFESQSLAEVLERGGFDTDAPCFLSWLGVSYYLTLPAIEAVFDFVATLAPGSEMVLDFWSEDPSVPPADLTLLRGVQLGVGGQGEPMKSFFSPEELDRLADSRGLRALESLDAVQAEARYLADRRDGLRLPRFAHLARLGIA